MKPRVLVLGASGFVGRRILHALATEGSFHPVAVSRAAKTALAGCGYETQDADASDVRRMTELMDGAVAVVNCVAGSPSAITGSAEAILTTVRNIPGVTRVVHLSSLAAYGSARGQVDESAALLGDTGPYSAAKAMADRLIGEYEGTVILRPGIVIGPGSAWWSDRIGRLLRSHRLGDLGLQGRGICNWVFVDDVATAVLRALTLEGAHLGAFNLGSPDPITWNEYFEHYAEALGRSPVRRISHRHVAFEMRLLGPPLKILEYLLSSPRWAHWNPWPPIRPWLMEVCAHQIRMDVGRAQRKLDMAWTPLDEALRITAKWFIDGGRTTL